MYNTLIDPKILHERLGHPGWSIIDCQYDLASKDAGRQAYLAEHLPGAVYADLHKALSSEPVTDCGRHPVPAREVLEERFSAMGISNHKQVVAYDNSGGAFAARLWWLLNYTGHARVAVLDGGLGAWKQAGFELEHNNHKHCARGSFKASINPRALVKLDEAQSVARLIDSREPERYAGEVEPIDPVAGHIPGAVNYYWKNNLDDEGRFLPPGRLRQALQEVYSDAKAEDVAFYCGSGVSACHNLLAATHAGYPLPRLYAGSWSEWCSNPERPIAVGME